MADNIDENEDLDLQEISAQPRTQTAVWAKERNPETGPPPLLSGAADRCYRWTAVCLGLLCVLLLIVSIKLTAHLLTERDQLLTNHSNVLKERDQLLTNHSNVLKERDQLLTNHNNLLKDRHQLLKLCAERSKCPKGWVLFEGSCYHNDIGGRSWSESRSYCQSLGGDLVLINTLEKQRFINEMYYAGWIGLRKRDDGSWRWLDDTPVSTWYWSPGQPDSASDKCVVIHNSATTYKTWFDYTCDRPSSHWSICEKPAIQK